MCVSYFRGRTLLTALLSSIFFYTGEIPPCSSVMLEVANLRLLLEISFCMLSLLLLAQRCLWPIRGRASVISVRLTSSVESCSIYLARLHLAVSVSAFLKLKFIKLISAIKVILIRENPHYRKYEKLEKITFISRCSLCEHFEVSFLSFFCLLIFFVVFMTLKKSIVVKYACHKFTLLKPLLSVLSIFC